MKRFISINGENKILESLNMYTNRAFKFGDGVFESIRIIDGKVINLKYHIDRLIAGAHTLKINTSDEFNYKYFNSTINELINLNGIFQGGRIRLSMFRSGEGAYQPTTNNASYFIEMIPIENNFFKLNENGLSINLYQEMKKSLDQFAKFKTINSLLYVQAAIYAKEENFDDSLILNGHGNIIETSSSNIFIASNGVLYTPPLEDGCVGGIMRMNVINLAINNGIKVYEYSLKPQNLLIADEVFLTNAIKGVEWVGGFQNKRYYNTLSKRIIELLNKEKEEVES